MKNITSDPDFKQLLNILLSSRHQITWGCTVGITKDGKIDMYNCKENGDPDWPHNQFGHCVQTPIVQIRYPRIYDKDTKMLIKELNGEIVKWFK